MEPIKFRAPPVETEFVTVNINKKTLKIPKVKLLFYSEFYSLNTETLGDEFTIDEVASDDVIDLFETALTNDNMTIPDNLYEDFLLLLDRWKCNDLIQYIKDQKAKRQAEIDREEELRKEREAEEERRKNMPKEFDVFIKIYDGRNVQIHVKIEETILDLKKKIFFKTAILPAKQFLHKGDEYLEDTKTIESYEITENMTLDLLKSKKINTSGTAYFNQRAEQLMRELREISQQIKNPNLTYMDICKYRIQLNEKEKELNNLKQEMYLNTLANLIGNIPHLQAAANATAKAKTPTTTKQLTTQRPATNTAATRATTRMTTRSRAATMQNQPTPAAAPTTNVNRNPTAAAGQNPGATQSTTYNIFVRIDIPSMNLSVPVSSLNITMQSLKITVLNIKLLPFQKYRAYFNNVAVDEKKTLSQLGIRSGSWIAFKHV